MRNRITYSLALLLSLTLSSCQKPVIETVEEKSPINWQSEWSDQVFDEAKTQNKLILLNLEARWCHWCHVMKKESYQNQSIAKILNEKFIPIRIDQDSNSYLSNRYKDYGWPATIIFNSQGQEIVKRAGYIEPAAMIELLNAVVANPSPEANYAAQIKYSSLSSLDKNTKAKLEQNYFDSLDLEKGGLNIAQKYIDRDTIEYGLILSKDESFDSKKRKIAQDFTIKTLENALAIMDSEWGGFYQYSTHGDWQHAHYEKLAEVQAEYLRIYSLAYLYYPSPKLQLAITKTISYLDNFLKNTDGSFFSSQDADLIAGQKAHDYYKLNDLQRRAKGIPVIDKTIYASKNGLIIEALTYAYKATQDPKILAKAIKAANAVTKVLQTKERAFKHSIKDSHYYLADNLYMSKAFLSLYEVTADPKWLKQSIEVANYISVNFKAKEPGYLSNTKADRAKDAKLNSLLKPTPVLVENIKLARLFNLLKHYSGTIGFQNEAKEIMKYLGSSDIAFSSLSEPGILIVDKELAEDPVHFTIVGSKTDSTGKKLYLKALRYPSPYLRVEWYDKKEAKLMNADVDYPELAQVAAFSCVNHACSLPIYDPNEL